MLSRYFNNPKDKADFGIAIVVIALAGILIGYFSFFDGHIGTERSPNDYSIHNTPIDTLDMSGMTYVAVEGNETQRVRKNLDIRENDLSNDVVSEEISNSAEATREEIVNEPVATQEEIDTDQGMDADNVGVTDGTKDDLLDSIIADENLVEEDDGQTLEDVSVPDQDDGVMEANKEDVTESKDIVEETIVTVPKNKAPTKKSSAKKRSSRKKYGCIVVIGAFGDATNIKKMIGKLDRDGYPIFKVPYNGLTRVGVYEECAKATSTLKRIQRKYSSDAFVMKAQ